LIAIGSDKSDFSGADPVVDPRLVCWTSYLLALLVSTKPPWCWRSSASKNTKRTPESRRPRTHRGV